MVFYLNIYIWIEDIKKYTNENLLLSPEFFISGKYVEDNIKSIKNNFHQLPSNNIESQIFGVSQFKVSQFKISQKADDKFILRKDSLQDSVVLGKIFPIKS